MMDPSLPCCVRALLGALLAHDPGSAAHSHRVAAFAVPIARVVGIADLGAFRVAALLHDVGKVAVSTQILGAPRPLSAIETRLVHHHAAAGAWVLQDAGFDEATVSAALSHHEHWDGRGYPDRLEGEEIPLWARVISAADTMDAMTYARPYRPGLPWAAVERELARCRDAQFDPLVVDAALGILPALQAVRDQFCPPFAAAA